MSRYSLINLVLNRHERVVLSCEYDPSAAGPTEVQAGDNAQSPSGRRDRRQ
jgi:hypothetical protein